MIAERETTHGLMSSIYGLMERGSVMSKYEYLAHITELSAEIAMAKKAPVDDIFRVLASVPREKLAEVARHML